MNTQKATEKKSDLRGLLPLIIIFVVLMVSPLAYFLINIMLGNTALFDGTMIH
jgi:hypothetical protein